MGAWFDAYVTTDNLIFLGILLAGFVAMYFCAIALKALRALVIENNKDLLWLFDGFFAPLMLFIVITAYSIAYSFLKLPFISPDMIERTPGILLLVNAGWVFVRGGKHMLMRIFKVLNQKVLRYYMAGCVVITGVVIALMHYRHYPALVASAIMAVIFILLVIEVTRIAPEIRSGAEDAAPRRLIMTHIYLATSETDEAVKRAIQAIKEAIEATDGTEKGPYASLAGFTHGAFDILIRYYISMPDKLDQVKQEVNLNIIKKLRDINIKLSER
jgi:small-conductance mechanosensitive channel